MNKKIYIGIYAASFCIFLLIGIPAILLAVFENFTRYYIDSLGMTMRQGMLPIYAAAILTYLQFTVVHVIYNFLMLGKMWGAIKDGQTPVTVGKAIGFLFIPLFNFYWVARAWGSFPTEYNKFIDRNRFNVSRLARFIFLLYPILQQVGIILFLPLIKFISFGSFLYNPIAMVLTVILGLPFLLLPFAFAAVIAKVCNAVNALEAVKIKRQDHAIPNQFGNQARGANLTFDAPR